MDRDPCLPPSTDRETLSKLETDFYMQYGIALANWARVEQSVCRLFCVLCALDPDDKLGRALFFSGRSFLTRVDLLAAAIRAVEIDVEIRSLLRSISKKARDYSKARNKIAHGYPTHMIHMDVEWQGWRIKEGEQSSEPGGIGMAELRNATVNFSDLDMVTERVANLAAGVLQGAKLLPPEVPQQVQALPPDAFLPSRYQSEAEPPPRDGR